MTKATIVITNYNQGHLIPRAIKSAVEQNFDPRQFNIVIVDDGSTDNSKEVINELVKFYSINHPELGCMQIESIFKSNGGTASARNAGIKAADGDIICFLDADDEYLPEKVAKSVKVITENPHVGVAYSDYIERMIDGSSRIMFKPSYNRDMLFHKCIVSTNSCVHKEVFNRVGMFDESIRGCEDYDLWLRIAFSQYMLMHIPEPLFIYNNHGENKTATFDMNKWANEERKIKERIMRGEFYVQNPI